ncbi:hypothetical protein [Paraflavitalea sp. CAU 1676]|uniref:hypothetical protein n=1 Tax=Paraflavitalea sp. CAU 1676 TaxID=3032598 RepID=UPI0023DC5BF0|nr:hypothetical protein [Paraflavitalea sp. CAU 1676]MDF2192642.1 hypothetical protein [Paraflavitalea sp. CAU 1676]
MSTIHIRMYDLFRKNLKLQEAEAKELVEVIQEFTKAEQAEKQKHFEQMVQKDFKQTDDRMTKEFGYLKTYMDTKFATKEDMSGLRSELLRTIYLTSLGQLIAIIASVISLVLILKK